MFHWFGLHSWSRKAVVLFTAAAVLLSTATSFGLAATVFEHGLGFHHAHIGDHDHDHDHDQDKAIDPVSNTDEIAAHHVHVVAIMPPVDSLPWIPGRTFLCECAFSAIHQACIYRLERIPKAFSC